MEDQKYLIYIDVLGFEELAEEISAKLNMDKRKIRNDFINVISEVIGRCRIKDEILGVNYGNRDDWILVTDSIPKFFRCVSKIINHNTGYRDFKTIPLEIGIGTAKFDNWAKFDGQHLVIEDETIKFLKTKIMQSYHNWCKEKNQIRVKTSFIIFTTSLYDFLEPLDKKLCRSIFYDNQHFFNISLNSFRQRGKLFEFLDKLNLRGNKLYERIDDLYIPPLEYSEIKEILQKERIVFITGTPEYGKTYTAIRLLWEYFNKDYKVVWRVGGEAEERKEVRRMLNEIESELEGHRIIYFEDPFGKAKYERRESLERDIGTIIDCIKNVKDVYVIVTSREEAFKEFEQEQLSLLELKKFEMKLNITKPSYDHRQREEMLLKWAESKGCKWLIRSDLRNPILNELYNNEILPTPLSIRAFTISSINTTDINELINQIHEKSLETTKSFAAEIQSMSLDKITFLSFLFISNFPISLIRREYKKLIVEFKIEGAWSFNEILNWFKNDKIHISGGRLTFSHSSYFETLKYLLIKRRELKSINNVFCNVLQRLSENSKTANEVVWAIAENFDLLPQNTQNLLFKLLEDKKITKTIALALKRYFHKFPKKSRNILLFKLSEKKEFMNIIAMILVKNYILLPAKGKDLLFEYVENKLTVFHVISTLSIHFDKIPEKPRTKLIRKIAEHVHTHSELVFTLMRNLNKLNNETKDLIFEIAEQKTAPNKLIRAMAYYYKSLPGDLSNLLFNLVEQNPNESITVLRTGNIFKDLPEDTKRKLVNYLSNNNMNIYSVIDCIAENFSILPEDIRNLLMKFAESDIYARDVGLTLVHFFDEISPEFRNDLLLIISQKTSAIPFVIRCLTKYFDKIPTELTNLLFKYSESEISAKILARNLARYYKKLPKDIGNLLFELIKIEKIKESVIRGLEYNFRKIPRDKGYDLLFQITTNKETAKEAAQIIAYNFEWLSKDLRIELITELIKEKTALGAIAEIIFKYYNKIPKKLREESLNRFSQSKDSASDITRAIIINQDITGPKKDLLLQFTEDKDIAQKISKTISAFYDLIPSPLRKKISKNLGKHGIKIHRQPIHFGQRSMYRRNLKKDSRHRLRL